MYKIGDVTVQLYCFVGTDNIRPWVALRSSATHSYETLTYLDADLIDPARNYATYTNETVIGNEKKFTSPTQIYVKDTQNSTHTLKFSPFLGSPYMWILKYDGKIYTNPDDGLNNENIYDTNIVVYYKYFAGYPGPGIVIQ